MPEFTTSQRLKQILDERNIKQIDIINLAKPYCDLYKVKLGRNDLSQYVSGKIVPKQNKTYILAKALNVSEAWLMGYDVPREREETNSKNTDIYSCNAQNTSFFNKYMRLNETGKEKTEAYVDGLLLNEKYTNTAEERRPGTPSLEEAMEMQKQHSPLRTDRLGHDNIVHKAAFGGGVWEEKPNK